MTTNPAAVPADGAAPPTPRLYGLTLAALGVVFGDIATSPLYAVRECFYGEFGITPEPANVLGILSLMFWALLLVVSLKYLGYVLRADNRGEGGVIALTALVQQQPRGRRRTAVLVGLGLFAASLLYGDGMITPAISVLSAVEGLQRITPELAPFVLPVTVAILCLLFLLQSRGTEGIGALFGPVILLWLAVLAALGVGGLVGNPEVLAAVDPRHGLHFLSVHGHHGLLALGAVFLVVTGAEAMYADLGHFGRRPIRLAWFALVLPALLLNYFGQGALLLGDPGAAAHPFYGLVPQWAVIPLLLLATLATIIASQAVISGAFSLTQQAMQLGYLPRLPIVHTSSKVIGQIYVPPVNGLLAVCTIGLVLGFGSSSRLAAAYGMAVTATMLVATVLFYAVARTHFGWSRLRAGAPVLLFLVVDSAFVVANLGKLAHGAWFPLAIAAAFFAVMTTWKRGRKLVAEQAAVDAMHLESLGKLLRKNPPHRVPGSAVYLASSPFWLPDALLRNLEHNRVLHERVAILHVAGAEVPRVPRTEKVRLSDLGDGVTLITATYGFMEDPTVPYILALAIEQGFEFDIDHATYFVGRERLMPRKQSVLGRWRTRLFGFLSRNAQSAAAFYHLPPDRVFEVGRVVRL